MKKLLVIFNLALFISFGCFSQLTSAAAIETSLLPNAANDDAGCNAGNCKNIESSAAGQCLGNKIICGNMHLADIPFYIMHIIDFFVSIAGIIAVLFIVVGGFFYIISGVDDDKKQKAKTTILHAITGIIVISLSWIVINVLQMLLTS